MSGEYDLESGPDPATFAAGAPEPDIDAEMNDPVYAVGVGPGNSEYLTPRGERAIREADALEEFAERVAAGESGTAVAMGDPNHSGYQFVGKVQSAVEHEDSETPVRVIPGISSLQMAASRARTPMEDTEFITLHKSGDLEADMDRIAAAVTSDDRHLLVLPRPYDRMPGDIAQFLLEAGADPDLETLVCEKLTHADEEIHRFTLTELSDHAGGSEAADTPFSDLVVLAVRQPVA